MKPAWTATTPLPGGNLGDGGLSGFMGRLCRRRKGFEPAFLRTLARRYGSLIDEVLGDARSEPDLGAALGAGLTEREVRYQAASEWARTPEDVLWRRTKCGLHMSDDERSLAAEKIAAIL
jgi:glycerol-3-phosphate dehydrogenase